MARTSAEYEEAAKVEAETTRKRAGIKARQSFLLHPFDERPASIHSSERREGWDATSQSRGCARVSVGPYPTRREAVLALRIWLRAGRTGRDPIRILIPIDLPSDEVCSLGHPMVFRVTRNGRRLVYSLYPAWTSASRASGSSTTSTASEHKESRPIPREDEEPAALDGVGEVCPKCGATDGGALVSKHGRFGSFVGCSRYPDCDFIKRDGSNGPPPDPSLSRSSAHAAGRAD
jgi:ssDNA-binding Zn-finger/Zn-ribbon topoisomerase 1